MDLYIAPMIGQGDGILAEPAIELRITKDLEKWDLSSRVVIREEGNHAFEAQAVYNWHPQVRFLGRYENTPGEFWAGLNESNTFHVGAELDLGDYTLTADASPDAFGAGKRARFGIKYRYQYSQRLSAMVHSRVRYLTRQDNWKTQNFVTIDYRLGVDRTLSLQALEHDFFDDVVRIKYTWKAL